MANDWLIIGLIGRNFRENSNFFNFSKFLRSDSKLFDSFSTFKIPNQIPGILKMKRNEVFFLGRKLKGY